MEVKPTPGPWEYKQDSQYFYSIYANGVRVATANDTIPEHRANACLTAAAPDLLEAIKAFLPANVSSGNRNIPDDIVIPLDVTVGELRRLATAVAKAEGRS